MEIDALTDTSTNTSSACQQLTQYFQSQGMRTSVVQQPQRGLNGWCLKEPEIPLFYFCVLVFPLKYDCLKYQGGTLKQFTQWWRSVCCKALLSLGENNSFQLPPLSAQKYINAPKAWLGTCPRYSGGKSWHRACYQTLLRNLSFWCCLWTSSSFNIKRFEIFNMGNVLLLPD